MSADHSSTATTSGCRIVRASLAAIVLLLLAGHAAARPLSRYAPYAFLLGEWQVSSADGSPVGVARFRLAEGDAYIWHSMSLLAAGAERPHYEGMLVWNGTQGNLDMLISVEAGQLEERGTVSIDADGVVVREITAFAAEPGEAGSAGGRFRQTFRPDGPDRVLTAVLHETASGWQPTFPGSDQLVMTRRRG